MHQHFYSQIRYVGRSRMWEISVCGYDTTIIVEVIKMFLLNPNRFDITYFLLQDLTANQIARERIHLIQVWPIQG